MDQITIGYFGIQWRSASASIATGVVRDMQDLLARHDGAELVERVEFIDSAGFHTVILAAYWTNAERYRAHVSANAVAQWWAAEERGRDGVGVFREVFSPRIERLETLSSTADHFEGIARAFKRRSTHDVQEHSYWGSMRDRMAASREDELAPQGQFSAASTSSAHRIVVEGHHNLALIRSGQNWEAMSGAQLSTYQSEIMPVLDAGMAFLSNEGTAIGCLTNRVLDHVDAQGKREDRSFSLSYWTSLEALETWAEFHPTHLQIFNGFTNWASRLGGDLALCLYHEVAVVRADEQLFEYIGCHQDTGILPTIAREAVTGS
ncbi:phenylacetaldoxime dehydratase family protein [Sphingobium sp. YG1]|uniref:phenylacetaldoxime dehydratase family protein n=1 Tax=Sphingobium sp. YG1 TaxID=2082188 RepID=UPI0015595857|nr:phenylacetaldoxime dehydratase family protein [Sphingobium sp. YG1]